MSTLTKNLPHILAFPFRMVWNMFILLLAMVLQVAWLIFVCGSVVGVILILVLNPMLFLLPMGIARECLVPIWPGFDAFGEKAEME
jgi:hypothetical protein